VYHFYEKSDMEKYVFLLYNSILYIGGNEMGPATTLQMAVTSYILILCLCFNAWLFSEMAVLVD
jgi:hypothetical protein